MRTLICSALIGFLLLAHFKPSAQVFTGNLTLATQAQVDAFNYTEVTGILFIGQQFSGTITNLDGLSELTKVGASIILQHTQITNVDGLSNVTSIGEGSPTSNAISISNNDLLTNLDGLSALTNVKRINIHDNPALVSISGLSGVAGIIVDVTIEDNDLLPDVDGLSAITTLIGDLTLKNCPLLANVNGLSGLLAVGGTFDVEHCPALTSLNGMTSLINLERVRILFSGITDLNAFSNINFSLESLTLLFNPNLENINGLSKIEEIGGMFIESNSNLLNLDGLSKLKRVEGRCYINSNSKITHLNGLSKLEFVEIDLEVKSNALLVDFCGLTKLFTTGSIGQGATITNNGANTVSITPPPDIILNNDPGLCSRDIFNVVPVVATVTGCLNPAAPSSSSPVSGSVYPVGTTNIVWSVYDGAGNSATAIQQVIISDNESPKFTNKPADVTVECAADVPAKNLTGVTATDNCTVTTINISEAITNQTCANRYTLTRTFQAVDPAGNATTTAQVITVYDKTPPTLTDPTPTQRILWPPNHSMREVTINYTAYDNCASDVHPVITVSSNEPINGVADGDTDPDWEVVDEHTVRLRAERAANGTGRIYTITVTIDDGCNPSVSKTTTVECVHNITGPHSGRPFRVGSTVDFAGEFWDKPGNKHTAKWQIDNSSVKGTVSEPTVNKNGKVTGSYKFSTPGVYKLQMNVTDQTGVTSYANTNGDLEEIVVIYDPNGGYVYGGGWFESQPGALVSDPAAEGKASYGFTVNYFKNSTYPKGEAQFEFKQGSLEFNALNFDYLVINGARAQFRGTGKITGDQSGYGFIMTVIDGYLDGSNVDKIRMKIYNKNNNHVIYDNLPGASDAADPVTPVESNSLITIYSTSTNLLTKSEVPATEQPLEFQARAIPNPSSGSFAITVNTNDFINPIKLQVWDVNGRMIEEKIVTANSITKIGESWSSGLYVITVQQKNKSRQLKIVKSSGKIY